MCSAQLGEAECKTAVMALRTELGTHTVASAHDVPIMMCQILQQLVQDHNTANLIRYTNRMQRTNALNVITQEQYTAMFSLSVQLDK
jgi:hypothetical protein